MIRRIPLAVLIVVSLARPALADDALRTAVADLASDIAKTLRGTPNAGIRIGPFRDPAGGGGGPGIAIVLRQELERLGLRMRTGGTEVSGEFAPVVGSGARIKATIADRNRRTTIEKPVRDERALAALFGPTVAITGDSPVDETLVQRLATPTAVADRTRVRAAKGATFAVEVLVGAENGTDAEFKPRSPLVTNGRASVPLKRGEAYALRLTNDGGEEAWASVTVDGINLYAFSTVKDKEGRPKYSRVVIDPKTSVLIRGWHHTHTESEQFVLTEFAKGAAAELGASPAGVGVIAVAFGPATPKPVVPGTGKRGFRLDPANPRGVPLPDHPADATGRGPKVPQQFLEADREYGPARELVGIRYTRYLYELRSC